MLWDDFINSEWPDWKKGERSEDKLESDAWLQRFITDHSLLAPPLLTDEELKSLRQLRALMLHCVQRIVGGQSLSEEELTQLNAWLSRGPVTRRLVPGTGKPFALSSSPVNPGWEGAAAEIAASFATALAERDLSRFSICSNPNCRWVYYDSTRNRSKRYCEDKTCGNLMKVRRFRAKHASAASEKQGPADKP